MHRSARSPPSSTWSRRWRRRFEKSVVVLTASRFCRRQKKSQSRAVKKIESSALSVVQSGQVNDDSNLAAAPVSAATEHPAIAAWREFSHTIDHCQMDMLRTGDKSATFRIFGAGLAGASLIVQL